MPSVPGEPDADHSDAHNAAALESVLDELTSEGIAPRDILVVVGRAMVKSKLYRRHTLGKHRLSNYLDIQNPDVVRVTTVRAVKGLEAQVVVMVELDDIEQVRESYPAMYARYMYIATSRAINFLIVLSTPEKSLLPVAPA